MIPAEAVEAAAKALHARECGWNDWHYIHTGRGSYEDIARTALEAAAAHILAGLRSELVKLAQEFDAAQGGTLAYIATTDDGRFVMRKNVHDQLMHVVDNHIRPTK